MSSNFRFPTLYIPHGGGPCFFMEPPAGMPALWDRMASYLRSIPSLVGERPSALLVVSAHWECARPTVLASARPALLYDYYGFPEHTYHLSYPAQGSPELAARVRQLLAGSGMESDEDHERGFDHGVFIPFMLIYPDANIPILQLSLQRGLDPATHAEIGAALQALRDEGVLIVGSGLSYHNLRHFFTTDPAASRAAADFHGWLETAVQAPAPERRRTLSQWQQAPGALDCHPRSEHLLPLMVAAGAAGADAGHVDYREQLLGKTVFGVRFGAGG